MRAKIRCYLSHVTERSSPWPSSESMHVPYIGGTMLVSYHVMQWSVGESLIVKVRQRILRDCGTRTAHTAVP